MTTELEAPLPRLADEQWDLNWDDLAEAAEAAAKGTKGCRVLGGREAATSVLHHAVTEWMEQVQAEGTNLYQRGVTEEQLAECAGYAVAALENDIEAAKIEADPEAAYVGLPYGGWF